MSPLTERTKVEFWKCSWKNCAIDILFINIVILQKNKIKHSCIFPCDDLDLRSRMCNLRWYLINNARQQCTRGDSADNLSRYQRRLNNGVDNTSEIYCSDPCRGQECAFYFTRTTRKPKTSEVRLILWTYL